MESKSTWPVLSKGINRKYFAVLMLLTLLLIFHPLLPGSIANGALLAAVIVSAWLVKGESRRAMTMILVLAFPTAMLIVLDAWHPAFMTDFMKEPLGVAMAVLSLALLVYCGIFILRALIISTSVGIAEILGTINLFMILGFIWAIIFSTLDLYHPGSFNIVLSGHRPDSKLLYFSFVTLTTLGYGDVTPQTPIAEMLSVIEAIIGQFYVAVVVAYLLSRYINRKTATSDDDGT